jgi:flagellar biosynthesis component FlhA
MARIGRTLRAAADAWKADGPVAPVSEGPPKSVELFICPSLINHLECPEGGGLLDLFASYRAHWLEQGQELPPIRIRDDMRLCEDCFTVWVDGVQVCNNHVAPTRRLAVDVSFQEDYLNGVGVWEPQSGQPGIWVEESRWAEMAGLGYPLLTPAEVVVRHVVAAVSEHLSKAI